MKDGIHLMVLLTLQLGISKMLKKPYFNLLGKNYYFSISLAFKSVIESRVI